MEASLSEPEEDPSDSSSRGASILTLGLGFREVFREDAAEGTRERERGVKGEASAARADLF